MFKSCSCSPRLFWPFPALLFLGRLLLSLFEKFSLRIFQGCFTVQLSRSGRCRISNFYKISHLRCCVNNFFSTFCGFFWRSCEKYLSKNQRDCQLFFSFFDAFVYTAFTFLVYLPFYRRKSTASLIDSTPISRIPLICGNPFIETFGKMQVSNPIFSASRMRCSNSFTALRSPLLSCPAFSGIEIRYLIF